MSNKNNERPNYSTDNLGLTEIGPGTMGNLLVENLEALPNKAIMLIGEPGIGKTAIINQMEKSGDYHVLSIRLVNEDEGTMNGYADPNSEDGTVILRVVKKVKEAADMAQDTGKRLVIFFDEINRAKEHMTKYVFNIIDTYRWGDFILPKNTSFVAAINPPTANHKVRDVLSDSALRRRFSLFAIKAVHGEYLEYARKAGIHQAVIGYLQSKPLDLYDYTSLDNGKIYACPASWDQVSTLIKWYEGKGKKLANLGKANNMDRMLTSILGDAVTCNFVSYAEDMSKRFAPENILNKYDSIRDEIKDSVNSEFTKEDADLDLSKISVITNNLAAYLANKFATDDKFILCIDPKSEEATKLGPKKVKAINKVAYNFVKFLHDCPSEMFQSFVSTLKSELIASSSYNEGTVGQVFTRLNPLVQFKEYKEVTTRHLELT